MSSLEIQRASWEWLLADPNVTALVGNRIFDQVPASVVFPYISIGPDQTLPNRFDCLDGSEIVVQYDVWSRAKGYPEVKRIAEAVRISLNGAPLVLNGYILTDFWFDDWRTLRDPDGLTSHAVLTFRALTNRN